MDDPLTARRAGGFVRDHTLGSTGIVTPDLGWTWERVVHEHQKRQLFGAVMDQLREEASLVGAHGVIDVRVDAVNDEMLSWRETPNYELRATGTAVRVPGATAPVRPFTTLATATQFSQYLRAGMAPSEALLGVGIVRADQSNKTRSQLRSPNPESIEQFSQGAEQALLIAINDIERQAATWGDGVVGCQATTDIEHHLGAGIEVTVEIRGTAVRRFDAEQPLDVIPILRLGDRPPTRRSSWSDGLRPPGRLT
jgi:uncharacterized protein YbjQ (UPF0145 family)